MTGTKRMREALIGTGNMEQNARYASSMSVISCTRSFMYRGSCPRDTFHEEKLDLLNISSYKPFHEAVTALSANTACAKMRTPSHAESSMIDVAAAKRM